MKIGQTILKLREEKKMSQEEFAQYYHVTRQTISNWEKEKNYPDLETLVKISDEAGVSIDSMLKDNMVMVQTIDKKVKHLKLFKIGTLVILSLVLIVFGYIGIQNHKQDSFIQTYKVILQELGFEKKGNNYSLVDGNVKYDVYMFERPDTLKWNQEMKDEEKFIIGTICDDSNDNATLTIRKTKDFITLNIAKNTTVGSALKVDEYSLDKNGAVKFKENMNNEDYKLYSQLESDIKACVTKLNNMYVELYE